MARRSAIQASAPIGIGRCGAAGQRPSSGGRQDTSHLRHRPLQVVVDDHRVESVGPGLLGGGRGQPPLEVGGRLGAPGGEPAPLLLGRRRLHEHQHGLGELLA